MTSAGCDILIVGGGVVGLTTALRLAEQGVAVTVMDRQEIGREASWAGAGMLPPGNLAAARSPEARLRSYSHTLWADLTQSLLQQTGIDNGYRVCGALQVTTPEHHTEFEQQLLDWNQEGVRNTRLTRKELVSHVPDLHEQFAEACYLPDFAQVRNPRHLQALKTACRLRGVVFREHVDRLQFHRRGHLVTAVTRHNEQLPFDRMCITAGAWSSGLLESVDVALPIQPVRGQIVQLRVPVLPFRCVIELGRRYLVPRPDGLILIGSTEEHAGFVKQNTCEGVASLLDFAISLVPALRHAEVVQTWSGLRPASPDELPLLGPIPGLDNVFCGTGHFRAGLQMSPGTAAVLTDLLLGRSPAISLDGLTCDRWMTG